MNDLGRFIATEEDYLAPGEVSPVPLGEPEETDPSGESEIGVP